MNMFSFIKPYRFVFLLVFAMGLISTFITAAQPMIGKFFIDEVLLTKRYSFSLVLTVAVVVAAVGYGVALFTKFLYFRMSLHIMVDMRTAFYQHLLHLPFAFFAKKRTGDILSRMNEDITEIQRLYTENVLQLFTIGLTFVFNVALLLFLNWRLTLLSFLFIPLLVFGVHAFRHLIFINQMEFRKASAKNQSFLYETFSAMNWIRTAHIEKQLQQQFKAELDHINKQNMKVMFTNASAQGIPQFILMGSAVLMLVFLGQQVMQGEMTLGTMLAFMAYQASLFATVQGMAQLYIKFQKGRASIQRINDFFYIPPIAIEGKDVPESFRTIHFDHVSFSHHPNRPILTDFTFRIQSGEKVGLIGENGKGKSTIAQLLAQLYEPVNGAIYLDDHNIREFSKTSWYKKVCLVAHDHPVWCTTIEQFLRLGNKETTVAELEGIIELVGLSEWIQALPEKMNTQLDGRGLTVSAGQKQRLVLARALLQEADIYIFDEATCHLDIQSEQQLFQRLQERLQTKTVIVITHRYDHLAWLDRIVDLSTNESKQIRGKVANEYVSVLHG
ncbi:ABC transporter ATP-binding protein [Bacillus sp. REN10]|uniref:ABC transporter ATP-binding protein n=1 Tax=Bacillus sp. REN10 TaxID=2782541 RepID=UPI00193C6B2F|nr:ABC transporter ATP-binding protein [Bacillus sp. REN10]